MFSMFEIDDKLFAFLSIQLEFIFSRRLFDMCDCFLDVTIGFTLDNFRYGSIVNTFSTTNILKL